QALWLDDVQDVTVAGNEITGFAPKAFGFANHSTDVRVRDNTIDPAIAYQIGMDDSSRPGYQGPEIGGDP
ncbi:MAG: right-handed parallel beta-helix repeat-containing protein, partial [Actinomycetes bacterium]